VSGGLWCPGFDLFHFPSACEPLGPSCLMPPQTPARWRDATAVKGTSLYSNTTRTPTGAAPTATTAHSTTTPASAATHLGHADRTCTRNAIPLAVSTGSSHAWSEAKKYGHTQG